MLAYFLTSAQTLLLLGMPVANLTTDAFDTLFESVHSIRLLYTAASD
jgi:hypothetical protein